MKAVIRKSLAHKTLAFLLGTPVLFLAIPPAGAVIDATLQMQLGNPTGATADPNNHNHYLIQRTVEAIDYNDNMGEPNCASWDLTAADVGNSGRSDAWATDTSLPPGFKTIPSSAYGSSGYDRGHMCPSADRTDTLADNELVFIISNIIPQASAQNQGVWGTFEDYCRSLTSSQELLIMCGPNNFGPNTVDSGLVHIASNTWKIVVAVPLGAGTALSRITNADPNSIRVIALEIPNTDAAGSSAWGTFITSTKQVQSDTGYNFFSALPNNLGWVLRSKLDGQSSPAPGAISFSPADGAPGVAVTITGTGLDTVTNITFNGTAASYTIISPTQITATVPAAAASGSITVRGLGGNAASSSSFTVDGASPADLAITTTHPGNFTQGDVGDVYTIVVTNSGGSASAGTVTVVEALPAGLTATAISGAGWTSDLGTLTCTRSDALDAVAAYPAITVVVSVAADALATVTNTVTVSGGGDTNLANNTVNDPTTINVASAPTVATSAATAVNLVTATLNGSINPNGQPATAQFQYGTDLSYGSVAPVSGPLTGTTTQAVSANITGLVLGTLYHFRVVATNILGPAYGLDQTFTTATTGVPDLAVNVSHTGNFTQGDTADTYTIIVTNVGTADSSGTVSVVDTLPTGLTATAISGTGWATDLGALTCTRSDSLAAGAAYAPIIVTVNVAANAPASVTNIAVVSGGGESNLANNTTSDSTTINPASSGGGIVTLAGWDVHGLPGGTGNYGPSPMSPTTNATGVSVVGLTRGSGVGTSNSGAQRAWGGNTWNDSSSAAALTANHFATFGVAANGGYTVSFGSISRFDYRHSSTGPPYGLLQYQVGTAAFADIAALSYSNNTTNGGSLSPIDLSSVSALQNVGAGTNVTFRIVNWGGTSSSGTWYIFDVANSTDLDFVVQGIVSPVVVPAADLRVFVTHAGSFTQGDTSDTYTIIVTNSGTAATVGTVSLVDALPAGLTATAIGGTGWTADLASLTCTRSDALPTGASYPPITVTVSVSAGAPPNVANIVTVAGGGDVSPANNTASDPTTILAAAAPTVATSLATAVGISSATLNGTVNPNSQPATAYFEYGLTTDYGSTAAVVGIFAGATAQAASASVTGLAAGTIYHFRAVATNVLGSVTGLDQTFTTPAPDLAITATHSGSFTQGDTSDYYTLTVTNAGTAASSGAVMVADSLPAGLTATAINGDGWTADLGTLTCTRSDTLAAGAAFPPITVTVSVAADAAANLTNVASVSGGGDLNPANNTAADPTLVDVATAPTVATEAANAVDATTATLNGTVNPNSQAAKVYFEYGLTTDYGLTATVSGTFTGTTAQAVSANITGLAAGTIYHFRALATNVLGSATGLDQTFTTTVPDPAITATHSGSFTQGDTADSYTIIVTNAGTGTAIGTVTVVDTLPTGVTATVIGGDGWTTDLGTLTCTRSDALAAGAAYPPITLTVSVAADAAANLTNVVSVSGGGDLNIMNNTAEDPTPIGAATAPTVATDAATAVDATTSTLNGSVNPNSQPATVSFDYGLTTDYGSTATVSGTFSGATVQPVSVNITGLAASTLYHFRAVATNVLGSAAGLDQTFMTAVGIPDLAITATHSGDFTQGDVADSYTITITNVGTAASIGSVTIVDTLPAGLTATAISGDGWTADLGTLTCTRSDALAAGAGYPPITVTVSVSADAPASVTNTVAVSGGGDVSPGNNTSDDPTTILPAAAPMVTTGVATALGSDAATLNGDVNPNGQSATAQFEYGLTADYGSSLPVPGSLSGTATQAVSASISGLLPATTYHFRLTATNILGATTAEDEVFTTLTPIEAWRLQWFGTTANNGPAADSTITTSDRMPNLLKYALGLNPLVATNNPVVGDIATGYLRLTAPKNPQATDVSYYVEVTGDIRAAWTTNGTTVDIDTPTLLRAHQNTPVHASVGGFIRLRVSRP